MYELNNKIRLISAKDYFVNDAKEFTGFIAGLISQDNDLAKVYLDGFLSIAPMENDDIALMVDKLNTLSNAYDVDFVISISKDEKDLPENAKSCGECRSGNYYAVYPCAVRTPEQYEIISGLSSGKYYVAGKRNRTQFCSVSSPDWMPTQYKGVEIPHCQSWGHKTSDVKWKLYYKSKELRDAVGGGWFGKPYIVDRWRELNFDENNVWRLEVSIKHCNKLLWNGNVIDRPNLLDNDLFILRDLYTQRFIVKKNEGHKDKSNDSQIEFLPLTGFHNRIRCKQYDDVSEEERHVGRISLLRRLVNAMDAEEVRYDAVSRDAVITHVRSIVKRDGLQRYFAAMVGKTLDEWVYEVTNEHAGEYDTNANHIIFKGLQPNTAWDI